MNVPNGFLMQAFRVAVFVLASAFTLQASAAGRDSPDPYLEEVAREQANIKTVVAFYQGLAKFDFEECRKYLGDHYIQHSPAVEDGLQGLEKALKFMRRLLGPKAYSKVDHKLILADGDYVALLSHAVMVSDDATADPTDRGSAAADIFRLENGKIVEHWDTFEAMPEKLKNSGMF